MNEKKKILYVWKSAFPWDVRVEKICMSLLNNGYDVYLACLWDNEPNEREDYNGLKIIRIGYKKDKKNYNPLPFNKFWKNELDEIIKELNPNLIINREIILADISGKLAKKYNIPIIMDMAENYPAVMKNWDKYKNTLLKKIIFVWSGLTNLFERYTTKLMNGILVVCPENKNRIVNRYNLDSNAVEIVYNSPSKMFFDFKRFNEDRDYKVIAYHGFINSERNLEQLLDVAREFKQYEFHLWGVITNDSTIKEDFKDCSNIKFFGRYKLNDLKEIIKQTDIGILPYIIDEHINNTISNKFFDYMANGIPVLCSSAKPMISLIDKTNCGVYADFSNKDTIREGLNNLQNYDWKKMGKNGYNAFKNEFNWEEDEKRLFSFVERFIK